MMTPWWLEIGDPPGKQAGAGQQPRDRIDADIAGSHQSNVSLAEGRATI